MVSMNSEDSNESERNDDKCKYFVDSTAFCVTYRTKTRKRRQNS